MRQALRPLSALVALLLVTATAMMATGGAAEATTPNSPWAQTDFNAAQSRANTGSSPLTPATIDSVAYLRSITAAPVPPDDCVAAGPAVSAPVLSGGFFYAVLNGYLTKVDAATGATVWRIAPDPSFSTVYPALSVVDGLVVLGGVGCDSQSDPNGGVQAFNDSDGSVAWSTSMSPDGGALDHMVVSDGYVVAIGNSAGSGIILSVHRVASGARVWFKSFDNTCSYDNALVDHDLVVFTGCNNTTGKPFLAANRLGTGARVWTRNGNFQLQAGDSDTSSGRHVYAVTSTHKLIDVDPTTGVTQHTLASAGSVIAVGPTRVFATCGSFAVCSYSLATGVRMWDVSAFYDSPLGAESGGVLYLDTGLALNTLTGVTLSTLWSDDATALVIGDGRIGVCTDSRVFDLYGLAGS
jgi:hypothetical protein